MARLDPEKSKGKFEDHLREIERLQKLNHKEGKEFLGPLNEKIRSLVNLAFDDGKTKLDDYKPNPFFSVSTGMSEAEKESNSQDYYKRRLDMMKNYVIGYLEELTLLTDNSNNKSTDEENSIIEISKDNFQGIMKVFISHKFVSQDQKLAVTLRKVLRSKNIEGYLAESKREYELLIGEKIRKEIENSDYVVGVITKESEKSASVNQELGYALGCGVPVLIMIEENVPHGVLTHGRDTEEFTRNDFDKSCLRVVTYILEKGARKKIPPNIEWLKESVYTPLYNKMMKIHTNPDKFRSVPSNPWQELEPVARLKCESDVKDFFEEYTKDLEKWNLLLIDLQQGFTTNQHRLGEIIKTAFEKVSLTRADGYILLDQGSSQEPRHWIDAFKFIIFDNSITNDEVLYEKLLDFAIKTNNGKHKNQFFLLIFLTCYQN